MKTILLKQKISNLKTEGFTDVERTLNVTQAHIDGDTYQQYFMNYFIKYERNGEDISHMFRNKSIYEWVINNSQLIAQRDENFEPILDEEGNEIMLPAFTYMNSIFEALDAIPYQVLRNYILDLDKEGKWDLTL